MKCKTNQKSARLTPPSTPPSRSVNSNIFPLPFTRGPTLTPTVLDWPFRQGPRGGPSHSSKVKCRRHALRSGSCLGPSDSDRIPADSLWASDCAEESSPSEKVPEFLTVEQKREGGKVTFMLPTKLGRERKYRLVIY